MRSLIESLLGSRKNYGDDRARQLCLTNYPIQSL